MNERSSPFIAAAWMMGAVASFSLMAVAGRELAAELDTFEIMSYRSAIGFVVIAGLIYGRTGSLALARTRQLPLHLTRNVLHFTGQNLWFYAVATIPLGQVVSLEFTNPIWVALLAPLFLGEFLTRARILAALMGFAGILIVARPGLAPLEIGHFAALGAAIGFAGTTLTTKKLSRQDATMTILFWMTLTQLVFGLVCAAPGGMAVPSAAALPWVLLVGVCGLTAHFSVTTALTWAPASVVSPMEFLRLPVLAGVGVIAYGERLEVWVFVGAALIISGNLYGAQSERRRQNARP